MRSALKETGVGNFYVLPRGVLPPNPADLLMSRKMQDVLKDLRNSFDFVLIDSPPAIAVSDAAVLSAFSATACCWCFMDKKPAPKQRGARWSGWTASMRLYWA
jgi:Mrp family chromosome partitioning ATPase